MYKNKLYDHGLDYWTKHQIQDSLSEIKISILTNIFQINIRGEATDTNFLDQTEKSLGLNLPIEPNTINNKNHNSFWLGPNEWLIITEKDKGPEIIKSLRANLKNTHASINDISGAQIFFRLTGATVREILSKGCTLDLHPEKFKFGMCAQTNLGKSNILLGVNKEPNCFDLIVRRSYSDYICKWLTWAASEYKDQWSEK